MSRALTKVRHDFQGKARPIHEELFARIGQEDPELLSHVERMYCEDVSLETDLEKLRSRFCQAIDLASDQQWDESMNKETLRQLSEDVIALVGRFRKQEIALET